MYIVTAAYAEIDIYDGRFEDRFLTIETFPTKWDAGIYMMDTHTGNGFKREFAEFLEDDSQDSWKYEETCSHFWECCRIDKV